MSGFARNYDTTIRDLESRLSDLVDAGKDFDFQRKGDVLEIEFSDGERVVITPQSPLEQLWISADFAGHRFNLKDGDWLKEKNDQPLNDFLSRTFSTHLGQFIEL
ncbi:MAG: iron donor protein CyaY [Bacteroidota bacterium]|nr:iron donor protein CyaY [Bacteroidota bacterium]MDP4234477.1 iron donor protein CyaY [Bacteroidota bacterium]MDP4244196.1 iron donor protein CyaY [Bacteroidota bacterium]MDP4288816.1 iron donor protein CyaY [Bacteroidota bacterium]